MSDSSVEKQLEAIIAGYDSDIVDEALEGELLEGEETQTRIRKQMEIKEVSSVLRDDIIERPDDVVNDYLFTRDVLHTLIDKTTSALEGALDLATESEHHRAFGIVRELVDSTKELTRDLMGLQKTYKEIKKLEKNEVPDGGNNGEVGGGGNKMSPSDLQRWLEEDAEEAEAEADE